MKTYLAYVRVSTQRQFDGGISLTEQRHSIDAYAGHHGLKVSRWFEEAESAASSGRTAFRQMLAELERAPGTGLLLHKIDRGARNLRDWADLGELIDRGVDVRFTHEDLALDTRGGRLAADLQAVVAADFVRNLRQEVKKGFYGRLRQGFYPLGAPVGYRDCGGGRAKMPDPVFAPLVLAAFERYATGTYTLHGLAQELGVLGLRTRVDKPLSPSAMSHLLRNPFYAGTCRVKGERYKGVHQPLVSPELFDRVQRELARRKPARRTRQRFTYARRLLCVRCDHHLVGERQKERVYYRCHQRCGVSVREDRIGLLSAAIVRVASTTPHLAPYESSIPVGTR